MFCRGRSCQRGLKKYRSLTGMGDSFALLRIPLWLAALGRIEIWRHAVKSAAAYNEMHWGQVCIEECIGRMERGRIS